MTPDPHYLAHLADRACNLRRSKGERAEAAEQLVGAVLEAFPEALDARLGHVVNNRLQPLVTALELLVDAVDGGALPLPSDVNEALDFAREVLANIKAKKEANHDPSPAP